MTLLMCNFIHSPVTSSLFGPNILLRTLFSNTLMTDQVSKPYKTSGIIMLFYILTFTFLDSRREEDFGLNGSKHSQNLF
jgi:hypothetical protein